jgi:hypothetical protein
MDRLSLVYPIPHKPEKSKLVGYIPHKVSLKLNVGYREMRPLGKKPAP